MVQTILDRRGRPVVVITGMGVVTSLGVGKEENWGALTAGKTQIRAIERFPTNSLRTTIAGTVDFMGVEPYQAPELAYYMAVTSAGEAISQAGIRPKSSFPGPLFLSEPPPDLSWITRKTLIQSNSDSSLSGYSRMLLAARNGVCSEFAANSTFGYIPERLAEKFGSMGQPLSVNTACAAGATAIQLGVEAIQYYDVDAALCVGTDSTVHEEGLIRFSLLSALSTQNHPPEKAAKPFSKNRDGFVMGEGAAALVLESYDAARNRGAKILGIVHGCGEKADDFHRTRSKPDGSPAISAIRNALHDAGKIPTDIDHINAHGTGTNENDKIEYLALETVFGDQLPTLPVSSNKSIVGHTLSAAGIVEAVFSLMTIQTSTIPPTLNYDIPDPEIPLDVVHNIARQSPINTVLSNSFGFGGQNVCLIFSGEPD